MEVSSEWWDRMTPEQREIALHKDISPDFIQEVKDKSWNQLPQHLRDHLVILRS